MGRPRRSDTLALCLALASGCSASSTAPKPDVSMEGGGADGSSNNGADSDGGASGSSGAKDDAGMDGYRTCAESAPRFKSKSDAASGASFGLVSRGLDVHVAFLSPTCIGVDGLGTAHGLRYAHFTSTGDASPPVDVAYMDGESCVKVQHPSLASVEGSVRVAYSAAFSGPFAVFGRNLAEPNAAMLSGGRSPSSIDALETDQVADASWSAWAEDDATRQSEIWAAGTTGEPSERVLVPRDAGYHVTALALRGFAKIGKSPVRAALAFASDSAVHPGVFLMTFDADMKAIDATPLRLSEAVTGAVSVDLQARGVLYTGGSTSAPDLRFRALNEFAKPVGEEIRVTDANEHAVFGSLAPFTVGYAIAYRSVRTDDPTRAFMRLVLIDPQGNLAGYRNLFETSAAGGRVLVRAAVDGRLVLGFRELSSDGSSELHVARITCGS